MYRCHFTYWVLRCVILTNADGLCIINFVDHEVISMVLNLKRLRRDGQDNYLFELNCDIEPLEFNRDSIRILCPVQVSGQAVPGPDYYIVNGRVTAEAELECARCLKRFIYRIEATFDQKYSENGGQEDELTIRGDEIDIESPVIESIILALPVKALCSQACKGICPHCGKDLNEGECACEKDDYDPRLAVLKELLEQKGHEEV